MKYTNKDFYKINGRGFYTADYIKANNINKANRYGEEGWCSCYGFGPGKDTVNVQTANGKVKFYVYGEKTCFTTTEERDSYRVEMNAKRQENSKKATLVKEIMKKYEEMSIEELEKILKNA